MDEEIDDERRSRIDKYSDEQGHYVPRRLRYELSARPKALAEADAVRQQKRQGQVGGDRKDGNKRRRGVEGSEKGEKMTRSLTYW